MFVEACFFIVVCCGCLGLLFLYETTSLILECTGLNSLHKRELVRYWLRKWNCDVVCLQETKLAYIDLQLVRSL